MSYSANAESGRLRRFFSKLRYWRPFKPFSKQFGSKDDYLAWFEKVPKPTVRKPAGNWHACAADPTMAGPQSFRFFGIERTLSDNRGWHWKPWGENWLYNLHGFDDLVADRAEVRADWHLGLITNWMVANPPGKGVGWQPDSLSRRIVNWIRWDLSHQKLIEVARRNLVVQALYLRQHLGPSLNSTYPTKAGKALLFAGAFFEGTEADHWRKIGLGLLRDAMKSVGGPDSVAPHDLALIEDMLDLVQLSKVYPGLLPAADVAKFEALASSRLARLGDTGAGVAPASDLPPVFFADPSAESLRAYAATVL